MRAKLANLSKNDRKLLIIVSSVAGGLVLAVVSVAIIIGLLGGGGNGDFPGLVEYENGAPTENAFVPPQLDAPPEEWPDFPIAPTALGRIHIAALDTTEFGVAVDSGFLISSETQRLTTEHLSSYLSSRCGVEFTLEEQAGNAFLLNFSQTPEPNAIINLVYQPPGYAAASHAFQTADAFRITATSPARNTHGIPTNAGIEITFNKPLEGGLAAFEEAFLIYPHAEGQFLQRDNTYIFAPTELQFGRQHNVTIRAGLESITGEILQEDLTFAFTTQWGTAAARDFSVSGNMYETFLPWNEVFVAMNISRYFQQRDFVINVYDLQTHQNFINFDGTETGVHVGEFEIELTEFQGEHNSFFFLFLGETLPVGYYVLEITSPPADLVAHKFIQVSPISVYSLSTDTQSVFWVHDAASGEPAEGARIIVDGTSTGVTNDEGVAIISTPQGNPRAEITIEHAGYLPFAYTKPTFGTRTLLPSERFLSYIYTDRPQYRPTDTIDVFGVIKPLYGQSHQPDDVFTLRIGNMLEMPIELDGNNSFAKRIPVENMFGSTDIIVDVNGEHMMSAWISFVDYANLQFVITGGLDRRAYNFGDYAHAEISLTTFAGRPAQGIDLSRRRDDPNITTNEYGIATESILITDGVRPWASDWRPFWNSFWFSVAGDAQISQSITLPYIVVPRDIMLEHELDGSTITVYTHEILTDRINEAYQDARAWTTINPDSFRGEPLDIDFQIEITRYVTTRTIRHQQYDHIHRRMITTYDFNTTDSPYRTLEVRTVNGRAVVGGLPVSTDPLVRYRIEIRYNDTQGRETLVSARHGWAHHMQESTIRHFHFSVESRNLGLGETTMVSVNEGGDPHWGWWYYFYGEEATPMTEGRMIAVLVRDGVISVQTGSPEGVPITFTESAITNAFLYGAYFDGTYVFPINNPANLNFDYSERELEIEISFNQENYSPGDEVTVTIQTSRQAQVLISVVDESSFQGMAHVPNFLQRLYRSSQIWHWHMNVYQFSSHRQHNFGGAGEGAEGGNGGDDGLTTNFRDTFVDNPIFEIVRTDANGNATFTFTLPDQITSWRVTALGLTEGGFAGEARENIISYLDFYADLLLTNEYIVGDDIAALARAFGAGGAEVNFTFNVLDDGEIIFTDSQSTTTGRAMFNAGKLPAGEYAMQLIATSGGYRDALELPFSVAPGSGLIVQNRASMVISPDAPVGFIPEDANMRPFPVRVTLTNANIRPLTSILHGASNSRSFRTDYIAGAAFREYFFSGEVDVYAVRSRVHAASGGIPELTYEDANFPYTARFAASFPEFVDPDRIRRYVQNELAAGETPMQRTVALLALAGIGEPVLMQIREEADNASTELIMLHLAAALVAIGDDAGAAELLTRDVHVPANPTASEQELTATLRFFINTAIDPSAAWAHVNRGVVNQFVSDVPERINFVRRVRTRGDTVSEFTYYHNGETHAARLEDFQWLHLHLTHEQFLELNIVPTSGETNYHIDFYGYDSTGWDPDGDQLEISRTITRDGDLYRVALTVNFPPGAHGSFMIYDRMPSNTRFVPLRRRHVAGQPWFFANNTQRQLVEIHFWQRQDQPRTRTVYYHVMELFDGDFAPGVTYVTNFRPEPDHLWGSTR
ncbi:MAG: Ig-like domain-containing protein [Defluviitaleaceae bacterium]|nr:Ig-like domain-containing protein [Defluviitaleaceae bacterium]